MEDIGYAQLGTTSEHIPLNRSHLKFGLAGHSYDATHDGSVTDGEDNTSALSLD